ncbi:MAG: hypothetical protein U0R69_08500 [Gaiellales bacterium]
MERIIDLLRARPSLALAAVLVPTVVVTALFAWQAVETQYAKNSLQGGLDGGTLAIQGDVGSVVAFGTTFVNEGDMTLTLESVGLITPTDGIELAEARAGGSEPGATFVSADGVPPETAELEGSEVAPGEAVGVVVGVTISQEGDSLGFDGLRIHFRAGGRAGETVDWGRFGTCAPAPGCDPEPS